MEHIAALLLVVGCGDSLADCRELPAPVPVFETVEECEALREPTISQYVTRLPQVFARCVEVDPALEEEDAELVWDVRPDGTLVASIEFADMMVATGPNEDTPLRQ